MWLLLSRPHRSSRLMHGMVRASSGDWQQENADRNGFWGASPRIVKMCVEAPLGQMGPSRLVSFLLCPRFLADLLPRCV